MFVVALFGVGMMSEVLVVHCVVHAVFISVHQHVVHSLIMQPHYEHHDIE